MQTLHHKKNTQGMIEFTNSFENKYLYLEKLHPGAFQELINAEYQVNSENSEDNLISQTTNKPIQF